MGQWNHINVCNGPKVPGVAPLTRGVAGADDACPPSRPSTGAELYPAHRDLWELSQTGRGISKDEFWGFLEKYEVKTRDWRQYPIGSVYPGALQAVRDAFEYEWFATDKTAQFALAISSVLRDPILGELMRRNR